MKSLILGALLTGVALLAQPTLAQQAGTPPSAAAKGQAEQPSAAEIDKQYARLQEQMAKMQEQMTKIRQTQDPKERQRLLEEHWASMQSAMALMHGAAGGMMGRGGMGGGRMMGGGMMGGGMMGGPMMGWHNYQNLTPEQLKERQYMMERMMPMQQMMMDQMMQHQGWMMQPPQPSQTPDEKDEKK